LDYVDKEDGMRTIIITLALILVALGVSLAEPKTESVYVTRVIDGGSIVVRDSLGAEVAVRILGVACPGNRRRDARGIDICARVRDAEKCNKKFESSDKALAFAKTKLLDKTVTLDCVDHCDKIRGQLTRYVKLMDGADYSALAIEQGVCDAAKFHPPHAREKVYVNMRDKAKKNKVGIHK